MTTLSRDPVLQWAYLARSAGHEFEIPPEVLLGLITVESSGRLDAVSDAGAFGLTQFIPSTAQAYDVKPNDPRSQIFGAARYLRDLGYHKDPRLALAKYNAGPANPAAAGNYPDKVLAAAKRYTGLPAATSSSNGSAAASATDDAPTSPRRASGLLRALVTVALILAGAGLAIYGASRLVGVQLPTGAAA
jgi:membrane-bound lytic murein transglycosylase B